MEHQRKWTGWLLIAVIVIISGTALVMNTLASPQSPMPQTSAAPSASVAPAETLPAPSLRTANASVIGYAGPVLVRLTLDEASAIAALEIGSVRFQETEGIGSKVREPDFAESFVGKTPPLTLGRDVDAVAGASISSKAVVEAVNEAAAFLNSTNELDASDSN